jgi:opacity protein-like surface antigen
MFKGREMRATTLAMLLLLAVPGMSFAQSFGASGSRANTWDFSLGGVYQYGQKSAGKSGSSLDLKSDLGFTFGLAYNITDKLALGGDFSYLRPDYTAIIADAEGSGTTARIDHTMSQYDFRFKGTYNFLDGPFTPFVELGLGWTNLDSNVAKGPPVTGCWWHPYWGYICGNYSRTFSGTDFSYGGSLGLRYDFMGNSFVRADYSIYQLDIGGDVSNTQLDSIKVQYGWRF